MGLIAYDFDFFQPLSRNLDINELLEKITARTGLALQYKKEMARNKASDGSEFYTPYYVVQSSFEDFIPVDLSFDLRYIGFGKQVATIDYLTLSIFYLCSETILSYGGGVISDSRRNEYTTKKSDNVYEIFEGMKFSDEHYQISLKKYSELS